MITLARIVSGGQTGVDRGALDAALAAGFPCAGWCPEGRMAEGGAIPPHYPLTELPGAGYQQRTKQNVMDSDGTLVIHFGELSGGTERTVRYCEQLRKPVLVVDGDTLTPEEIAVKASEFVMTNKIATLNVAGPRESSHDGAAEYSRLVVTRLIALAIHTA
ncbi:MAG: putative molybdenum carrier protein [Pseudomonadota bacterium]